MDKVDKLIDWVATGLQLGVCARCKEYPSGCETCTELESGRKVARQILSHPDLALIDRSWRSKERYLVHRDAVILLAEAIKEKTKC